jgi:hypothetical protein
VSRSGALPALVLLGIPAACAAPAQPPAYTVHLDGPAPTAPAPRPPRTPEQMAALTVPEQEAAAREEAIPCAARATPRAQALCHLASGSEAGLAPLFALGRVLAARPAAAWPSPDFTYVAETAGALAAGTTDASLHAAVRSDRPFEQMFGVIALRYMLLTLRLGNARGTEADAPVWAERMPRALDTCAGRVSTQDPAALVRAAADCLEETPDPRAAAMLVEVGARHPDVSVQVHLIEAARSAPRAPRRSLQKLVPILTRDLPGDWKAEDTRLRGKICKLLLQDAPRGEDWPAKPAQRAADAIGGRDSQARLPCEALARAPATAPAQRPPAAPAQPAVSGPGALVPIVVRQTDYLKKLADRFGFDADAVWNQARNAGLRQRRDPNLLEPGDILWAPRAAGPSGAPSPRAVDKVKTTFLRLTFSTGGGPRFDEAFKATRAGLQVEGRTDLGGTLIIDVPVGLREFDILFVKANYLQPVIVGQMDPIDEPSGIRKRLQHLGFRTWTATGEDSDEDAEAIDREALRRFQAANKLEATGVADEATKVALVRVHGS